MAIANRWSLVTGPMLVLVAVAVPTFAASYWKIAVDSSKRVKPAEAK